MDVASDQDVSRLGLYALRWNPQTNLVASTDAKYITLWNADTSQRVIQLGGYDSSDGITTIAWSPDGARIGSGNSLRGTIMIWQVPSGKLLQTLPGHNDQINSLAFSPDGQFIACAGGTPPGYYGGQQSTDNTIRIWNSVTGQLQAVLVGHTAAIYEVGWSSDGQRLASVSSDETIRIWGINQ